MTADLKPCGTHAAYQRHKRHGEQACPACLAAHSRESNRNRVRTRRPARPRPVPRPALPRRRPPGRTPDATLARIEDYQFIRGDQLPARKAAERLGVSDRTIRRYRARLRQQTTEAA